MSNAALCGADIMFAYSIYAVTLTVVRNRFISSVGGSLLIHGRTQLLVNCSVFESLVSNNPGAAISVQDFSSLQVVSSSFRNCSTIFVGGGAIYVADSVVTSITDTVFSDCSTLADGGALLFRGISQSHSLQDVSFLGNFANRVRNFLSLSPIFTPLVL
jgi:hypothetical protein